jgi:hypothetical protein
MDETADNFAVLQGEVDGHPVIAVLNRQSISAERKKRTPWFVSIVTFFETTAAEGMPPAQDVLDLSAWEDRLHGIITAACPNAVYVGRVTGNGQRELMYYVEEPDAVINVLKGAEPQESRPFSFQVRIDDDWSEVSAYVEAIRPM